MYMYIRKNWVLNKGPIVVLVVLQLLYRVQLCEVHDTIYAQLINKKRLYVYIHVILDLINSSSHVPTTPPCELRVVRSDLRHSTSRTEASSSV